MNDLAGAMGRLRALGQSVWLDHLRRSMTRSGALAALVEQGLSGITSNPSIFADAITSTTDYDAELGDPQRAAWTAHDVFERLAVDDVREAADVLRPVYQDTNGADGFASIEVSPALARDTDGSIREARRLWQAVNRPNVMIKIPGTREGWPAIEQCLREGINVNVTLLFTLSHYESVAGAYLRALEGRLADGLPIDRVASVASVFISRVDTEIDRRLDAANARRGLRGRAAIANARVIYAAFRDIVNSDRWRALERAGARCQRPLWASMATKNAAYSDVLYVESLIGPDTIATVPPGTLRQFADHGTAEVTLPGDIQAAERFLLELESAGIDFVDVNRALEDQGLEKFTTALEHLLAVISRRRKRRSARSRRRRANAAATGPAEDPIIPSRWRFLAEASARLDESPQYRSTLVNVMRLAVPRIADYAVIALLTDEGGPGWGWSAHRDPSGARLAAKLRAFLPELTGGNHRWAKSIHDNMPRLVRRVDDDQLRDIAMSETQLSVLRHLKTSSFMLIPLAAWGRTLGTLLLAVTDDSGRWYTRRDLVLATELGRRVSLTIDNARLYRAVGQVARRPPSLGRVMPRMGYRYHLEWSPPETLPRRLRRILARFPRWALRGR
jgi:transaldolase